MGVAPVRAAKKQLVLEVQSFNDFQCVGVSALYLEATLPPEYPDQSTPHFSLGNLNNSHWSTDLKQEILSSLQQQVRALNRLGTAMDAMTSLQLQRILLSSVGSALCCLQRVVTIDGGYVS